MTDQAGQVATYLNDALAMEEQSIEMLEKAFDAPPPRAAR